MDPLASSELHIPDMSLSPQDSSLNIGTILIYGTRFICSATEQ